MSIDILVTVPEAPAEVTEEISKEVHGNMLIEATAKATFEMPSHSPPELPKQDSKAPKSKLEQLRRNFEPSAAEEPNQSEGAKELENHEEVKVAVEVKEPEERGDHTEKSERLEEIQETKLFEISNELENFEVGQNPQDFETQSKNSWESEESDEEIFEENTSEKDPIVEEPNEVLEPESEHVLAISEGLSSKEEPEASDGESSPGERTDVSSYPNCSDGPVGTSLPSLETLVVEAPSLVQGYRIGICCLPIQKERMIARDGVNFTMMVAGRSGLGKSTFVNTLFDTCVITPTWQGTDDPHQETRSLVKHRAILEVENFKLHLNVIDTPGFGNRCNNTFDWVPLVNYIDEQMTSYIFQEEQPYRSEIRDDRVHCCLYFLEPTNKGLSALDVIAMKEISKRVNMVPIIAKADALSWDELKDFKREVRAIMHSQNIKVCQFLDESSSFYHRIFSEVPFGIVGSDIKVVDSNGRTIHVRKYCWGTVEVENPEHCDFSLLKDVLISNHMVDFVRSTEEYYESCRTSVLKTRILKARDRGEADETGPCGGNLKDLDFDNVDNNGLKNYLCYANFDKRDMDSLVAEWSPEFVQKRWDARKKFNEVVSLEDQKFQKWKKALQNKQIKFNQEIELLNQGMEELQLECHELESQIMTAKAVHRTRSRLGNLSGTISKGEKRALA